MQCNVIKNNDFRYVWISFDEHTERTILAQMHFITNIMWTSIICIYYHFFFSVYLDLYIYLRTIILSTIL